MAQTVLSKRCIESVLDECCSPAVRCSRGHKHAPHVLQAQNINNVVSFAHILVTKEDSHQPSIMVLTLFI